MLRCMRMLVLGGTRFVSHAVAAEAVARGHEVVCAARGRSGAVPRGARLVEVDRDVGLDALVGESFDAVVDVAAMSYPWVLDALRVLGPNAGHWTFVSTVNVYTDTATGGQTPGSPVHEPLTELPADYPPEQEPELYGATKVAAEDAVRENVSDRAFVVRPGLVVGPDDLSDRFGYWPGRFARGGRVVVPDVPDQPIQYVDVRDLAAWIVDAGERGLIGTFDAIGPVTELGAVLDEIASRTASEGAETVRLAASTLTDAGVNPWGGPKSLPLWLPETHHGIAAHDAAAALEAGLPIRPLAETALAALEHERTLGLDRVRSAGLSPEEEAELLDRA